MDGSIAKMVSSILQNDRTQKAIKLKKFVTRSISSPARIFSARDLDIQQIKKLNLQFMKKHFQGVDEKMLKEISEILKFQLRLSKPIQTNTVQKTEKPASNGFDWKLTMSQYTQSVASQKGVEKIDMKWSQDADVLKETQSSQSEQS